MGRHYYNVTLMLNREHERRRLNSGRQAPAVREVLEHFSRRAARVYAWVVMPDHIHLLFSRTRPLKDIARFAGRIKRQVNQRLRSHGDSDLSWRDGCIVYEVSEQTLAAARDYILANPVRGKLASSPAEYELAASPSSLPAI
ncbi:MAG: transposase [Planctomycetaceae bacterium]|nr:hypothetical protein [Planctomycetota bacterium]NUO16843.1 transposase [Planctomycetaceae bacterium]HRJ77203.1 transposase [Planctomycetota bacterium]